MYNRGMLYRSIASQIHLKTVIIELACELVVMFWLCLSSSRSTLAKHLRQVVLLSIDLHLTAGFAEVALKSMWVNNLLNFLSLIKDQVICSHEVSPLKDILSLAMTKHNVTLDASLRVLVSI